ncbi:MAG TPA: lipopolysaccharide assembly protein LapA domain-containing protein [Usitatibacteraceae bacterium]|nr:lipopolysaccharide assembly protein LapA domain-containing protein [Usitatibacteraceae bacterium]
MQALAWIVRIAILLVLVWFAVRNGQEVELRGLPDQSWKAPLIFVVLVAFVAGVIIGLTAWLPTVVRQRREVGRLRKAASTATATVAAAVPVAPAPEPTILPAVRPDSDGV